MNDIHTLRYFFNLGVETFRQNQNRMSIPNKESLTAQIDSSLNQLSLSDMSSNSKSELDSYKSTSTSFNTTSCSSNNPMSSNNVSNCSSVNTNNSNKNTNNMKHLKIGNSQKRDLNQTSYPKRVTFESRYYHGKHYNKESKNSNFNNHNNNNKPNSLSVSGNNYNNEQTVSVGTNTSTTSPYCISPIAPLDPSELNSGSPVSLINNFL